MQNDFLQAFIFDNTDIRGVIVKLGQSFRDLLQNHDYSAGQQQLLGEFVTANLLMTNNIKLEGLLSLQARGENNVSLIMAECTDKLDFRGIIRGDQHINPGEFHQLFANGVLAITIEPNQGKRYQGAVPLDGNSLAECLAGYFAQSEQLPSWFYFAVEGDQAAGFMLQALPANICHDPEQRKEDWQRIVHLASTLRPQEMLSLSSDELLHRLYHEEQVRLFDARPVRFSCTCSQERMERALINLGEQELLDILDNEDHIETQCHFCNRRYEFLRNDILHLLQGKRTH